MKTLGAKGPCFPKSRINENSGNRPVGTAWMFTCIFYRFGRLFEMRSSNKFTTETFLAYLQRSTISSTDLLEPSLPMAKSAVTENIPKQTEFERHQHKVGDIPKRKHFGCFRVHIQFPGSVSHFAWRYKPITSTCNTLKLCDTSNPWITFSHMYYSTTSPYWIMANFLVFQETEGEWTSVRTVEILGVRIPAYFTTDPQLLYDFITNFQTKPNDVFIVSYPNLW